MYINYKYILEKNLAHVSCQKCEKLAKRSFRSTSTYTGPLPEAKPCRECESILPILIFYDLNCRIKRKNLIAKICDENCKSASSALSPLTSAPSLTSVDARVAWTRGRNVGTMPKLAVIRWSSRATRALRQICPPCPKRALFAWKMPRGISSALEPTRQRWLWKARKATRIWNRYIYGNFSLYIEYLLLKYFKSFILFVLSFVHSLFPFSFFLPFLLFFVRSFLLSFFLSLFLSFFLSFLLSFFESFVRSFLLSFFFL